MSDHDILSDAERKALSDVMLEPDLPPQRVLIVDDDKDARELLSEILALDGVRCMTAASGETALKMVETMPSIGLVITDLRMRNVDGLGGNAVHHCFRRRRRERCDRCDALERGRLPAQACRYRQAVGAGQA
jgi:CheY-like chemotaxis protein